MIIVAKMVTVLTRRAHITVSVMQDTDKEWSPQDGSVKVSHNWHVRFVMLVYLIIQ